MCRAASYRATALGVCLLFASCIPGGNFPGGSSSDQNNDGTSVGDVFDGGAGRPADVSSVSTIGARVRNESDARADVTLRFLAGDEVIHLAFARVPPATVTTMTGPESTDVVEFFGVDDRGRALPTRQSVLGVDFEEGVPAEYTIRNGGPIEPPPGKPDPPALMLTAPANELTLPLGSTFKVEWEDAGSPTAVISLSLRGAGDSSGRAAHSLGPAIGAALDGINDSFLAVMQGVPPGRYEVVGRIVDGEAVIESVAPGVLNVVRDPLNVAPTVSIRQPLTEAVLRNGDSLTVRWIDADPDDNAVVVFSLVPSGPASLSGQEFVISPAIAEDPDGASDTVRLTIRDVLPGLYDLVAVIDDGRLIGTDRVVGAVRVLPSVANDLPRLDILEPFADVLVIRGGSLAIRWTDSDDNDNARISFLLDPDLGNELLNGNEIVLASGIAEDDDGPSDRISVLIPPAAPPGRYRLLGVITDGLTQVITRSPGGVTIVVPPPVPPASGGSTTGPVGGSGGTNGGGGGPIIGGGGGGPVGGGGGGLPIGPSTEVTQVLPAVEIIDHPGELITVMVTLAEGPLPRRSRVYLGNVRYGGSFRADVTPLNGPLPTSKTFSVVVNTGVVPNTAWPRRFDVELETLIEGVISTNWSPRPILIRQEVETTSVRMLNYVCRQGDPVTSDGTGIRAIEWTWYGGGYDEAAADSSVSFWLTADGRIPVNGNRDATHALVYFGPASPNAPTTSRVEFDWLRGVMSSSTRNGGKPVIVVHDVELQSGWYWLVAVLDDASGGTTYPPFTTRVEICAPATAGSGEQP